MLTLTLHYTSAPPPGVRAVEVMVPDMGLTPQEWAVAAVHATYVPNAAQYGVPGALEIATALSPEGVHPLVSQDRVTVNGWEVTVLGSHGEVSRAVRLQAPLGPGLYVARYMPPPESIAYAEDARDRLWTGRGAGTWRCLTDPAGRANSGQWSNVWLEYGPLVPLVPVEVLSEPQEPGRRSMAGQTLDG